MYVCMYVLYERDMCMCVCMYACMYKTCQDHAPLISYNVWCVVTNCSFI
jgi:hypothetical protein